MERPIGKEWKDWRAGNTIGGTGLQQEVRRGPPRMQLLPELVAEAVRLEAHLDHLRKTCCKLQRKV